SLDKAAPRDSYIVSTQEEDPDANLTAPMTLDDLRASVRRVIGADLPMSDPTWLTRLVGNSRQAERYRSGRVLLAGDAAHVYGLGGSINAGLLDAMNLGWKLAAVLRGRGHGPAGLLDTYHAERHPAGARSLLQTRAQRALQANDPYATALRELVGELLSFAEPQQHVGELIAGSDMRYQMDPAGQAPSHPLTGRLAPDLRVDTGSAKTRLAELMRSARPVLLDFTSDGRFAAAAADWSDLVTVLTVKTLSATAPADGLLIRPDGYVAWAAGPTAADGPTAAAAGRAAPGPTAADDPTAGLRSALRKWFGD
ncbi:MAG: FAD-dependent monooxygenase, partial [Actinobacteria bacterium]|nr:FAD-dependent monooxygenase [Actinomycetota bacterium]